MTIEGKEKGYSFWVQNYLTLKLTYCYFKTDWIRVWNPRKGKELVVEKQLKKMQGSKETLPGKLYSSIRYG